MRIDICNILNYMSLGKQTKDFICLSIIRVHSNYVLFCFAIFSFFLFTKINFLKKRSISTSLLDNYFFSYTSIYLKIISITNLYEKHIYKIS